MSAPAAGYPPAPDQNGPAAAAPANAGQAKVVAPPATQGATQGAASVQLQKKIQKVLALRPDAQASRDALNCLSGFFTENTVYSRRNLRTTVESQNLHVHQEFVSAFEKLEQKFESLDALVNTLDNACEKATGELKKSRSETQVILEKAASLKNQSGVIEEKQLILSKFLEKFKLPDDDLQIVKSADRPIDNRFFEALEKLEGIRCNARRMLSTYGQQTSGVDILHETSEILESAFERLFVWVQQQCRGARMSSIFQSTQEQNSQSGNILKRSLTLLRDRPVYFNHCVRDVARVRRQMLVQRFHEALSRGEGPKARPIEMQAYDPVRYVGDMLAWIHENVATEKETISSLMGGHHAINEEPSDKDAELALVSFDSILDFALEGLIEPFKSRVEGVMQPRTPIITVYKTSQVFSFYSKTLQDMLKQDSGLVHCCKDLHNRTHQQFLDMWDSNSQKLRSSGNVGVYVSDLSTPAFVTDTVNILVEVLAIYESALVPAEEREMDFLPILGAALDPLLNHCQQVASMMDPMDASVFLINCMSVMQTPLRKHDFTTQRVTMFAALLDDEISRLVDGQTAAVLQKLGLAERLKALREKAPETPIASVPELHPVSLAATLRSFYNSLFTLGALALPQIERLGSQKLRSEARSGVARLIAVAYRELYEGVKELGVATHTPEQVETLLE